MMTHTRSYATRNDLPLDVRQSVVRLLNQQLADCLDLYSQAKQAHWNVKGPHFHSLHKLFDDLAGTVVAMVDMIAERAAALGGAAAGTLRLTAAASRLPEYDLDAVAGWQHVETMANRCAAVARTSRAAIDTAASFGDSVSVDLFTEVSRDLDKQLWLLETHLQTSAPCDVGPSRERSRDESGQRSGHEDG